MWEQLVVAELFAFMLIFCRVGAGLMVMPGFGEMYVPQRVKLVLALGISLLLTPLLAPRMPPVPATPMGLLLLVWSEVLVGLLLGGLSRIMISAVHMAGLVISYQSSLATAMMLDLTQAGQTTSIGNFMGVLAVVLVFATGLHHLMLRAITDSYLAFAPGMVPPVEDFARAASLTMTKAFAVAMQLSAPHLAIGLIMYVIAGILARLMPTMQVFFILMPPQVMIGLFVLMTTLSAVMLWFVQAYEENLSPFVAGR